ncbi:hypothetical protein TKK_0018864 [Trichogramma kaykai]|uniref:Protein with SprT-like domain at the N terminus n=1 Tax=Trichogramma kaykai TaxID=54128 RepID=A0ABD2VWT7_9HYME
MSKYQKNLFDDELDCLGVIANPTQKNKNDRPVSLVDSILEITDPTPNIHALFVQFNANFFWSKLLPVQVKWSPRMTSCAGICSFNPRNRECIISLSTPLLKLRPRKDLVETLLHEMIHAYLFLTNNDRDRDGHGPNFQNHMRRINNAAGTNITIYHTFHDEVKFYQQHWWRCNGPCQNRAPFFGTVRRAMNRAPGPNDLWWNEHEATCGGKFIKIKEPEKVEKPKKKADFKDKVLNNKTLVNWVQKTNNTNKNTSSASVTAQPPKKSFIPNQSMINKGSVNKTVSTVTSGDLKKLGNSTNNVHGWGTGGPSGRSSDSSNRFSTNNKVPSNKSVPRFSYSGTLGGSSTGQSILIQNNFTTKSSTNQSIDLVETNNLNGPRISNEISKVDNVKIIFVTCPSCDDEVEESKINEHLDECLQDVKPKKKRKVDETSTIDCPICSKTLKPDNFNDHFVKCAELPDLVDLTSGTPLKKESNNSNFTKSDSSIKEENTLHVCLICNVKLKPNESLSEHLEECTSSLFDDGSLDSFTINEEDLKNSTILDEYPCPVCMKLVKESKMNEHLDVCTQT